ncbi:hypothetical protein FRC11_000625 [Ceratobasidium sp. 423]|nr:hypothetical protein FRC11_000625 [Ceratobasidium sp. 423]
MSIEPGVYRIKNAAVWTTIDESTDGQHVIHGWQQTNEPNQHWRVERILHNVFSLQNVASGLFLHADGIHNGSKLVGSNTGSGWYLIQQEDGSVYITSTDFNYVVDLDNGNAANGTTIHLWEKNPNGTKQQQWFFERL